MIYNGQTFASPKEAFLAHYGVKGMRWGYRNYQNKVLRSTPGATKTKVIAKTGEKISVEKEKPGPLILAVSKLTGRDPGNNVSSMVIRDSAGKKVGSFQVWREGPSTVRGEWLTVKKSAQGQGYSKAAIEGLMKAADKDPSLTEVRLQVPSQADAAKHIYSSLGFKKDKDLGQTPMFGNLEDWVYETRNERR
jgi:ribosomal protein S18 acetylase RimI-like enzyme